MSLIRPAHKMRHVKGLSNGYVFLGSQGDGIDGITDYGCPNPDLVEIFARFVYAHTGEKKEDDYHPLEAEWLLDTLAKRLHVQLEKPVLTHEQADAMEEEWHNVRRWRDYIKESAKDDWTVYSEEKEMWDYRVSKINDGVGDWMVRHYGTFDKVLEEAMARRDKARRFVEKYWDTWRTIKVPYMIFESLEKEKENNDKVLEGLR